jgi:Fic family protein
MSSFSSKYLRDLTIHPSSSWLISQCAEARGKQDFWQQTRPEILNTLHEYAMIQSTESSNRIEGVEVEAKRLLPLVSGKIKPIDRPEEEVVGYKKALNYIYKNFASIKINAQTIKKLHSLAQQGNISDAGKFKTKDNEIIEILANGERVIRFRATPAKETEKAIDQLCLSYNDVISKPFPDILIISSFVFDFLCIHPFRDGNGRVSRLLTILICLQNGFSVVRYISIERIIEENKEEYYKVLKESSNHWHESKHQLLPWWNYFFRIIREAYKELSFKVENAKLGDNKSEIIRQIILEQVGPFKLSYIQKLIPTVSQQLIKKVLSDLKKDKKLKSFGRGAGSVWEVL